MNWAVKGSLKRTWEWKEEYGGTHRRTVKEDWFFL